MKITIEGGAEIEKLLEKIGDEVERESVFRDAAQAGAQVIADHMKTLAPGPHIYAEIERANAGGAEAAIGPDKDHWYYQFFETGTQAHEVGPSVRKALRFAGPDGAMIVRKNAQAGGMAARPFVRPSLDQRQQAAADAVGKAIATVIERIARAVG